MSSFIKQIISVAGGCIHRIVYTEGMTPLPKKVMFVLFLVMFFGDMTNTMCFSYLPKMVKSFGTSEVLTGKYAGFIATSVYLGYVLCSILWGYVGDTIGNKRTLIIALSGLTVSTLVFGFSTSYYWALFSRLAQGLFLGFNVVAKSVLVKSTDESNVSLAFSIYFTFWTLALTIGPSLGGFLAFPVEQYPGVFQKDSLLGKYNTLLPNIVITTCLFITIMVIIMVLPNDHEKNQNKSYSEVDCLINATETISNYTEDKIIVSFKNHSYKGDIQDKNSNLDENVPLLQDFSFIKKMSMIISEGGSTIVGLFHIRKFVICLFLYALSGFAIIGVEEMYPLFAATTKQYKGLALTTSEIGIVLLCSSSLLLVIQITIMSKLCKYFGPLWTFIGCSLTLILMVPLIPTTSAFGTKVGSIVYSVLLMMICMVLMNGIYISINILINNIVEKDVVGSANGVAWTASCVGRLLAAFVFGNIYSWSLTNVRSVVANINPIGFPFNQFLVFFVAALCFLTNSSIAGFCLSSNTPKSAGKDVVVVGKNSFM